MDVPIRRLEPAAVLPAQQHAHDAGHDLCAIEPVTLAAGGGRALVRTGLALAIPPGYAGLVLPRSGLALKHGVTVLNTPGLIDAQYRGELKVLLVNTDRDHDYAIAPGDRIAQLVIQAVADVGWQEVDELDATTRDTFGFGSTGR
jgi:dUTP pyrophosphatase